MAGHRISAYADEQTYRKVSELAKAEHRSTAQIVAAAVLFYTGCHVERTTRCGDWKQQGRKPLMPQLGPPD